MGLENGIIAGVPENESKMLESSSWWIPTAENYGGRQVNLSLFTGQQRDQWVAEPHDMRCKAGVCVLLCEGEKHNDLQAAGRSCNQE